MGRETRRHRGRSHRKQSHEYPGPIRRCTRKNCAQLEEAVRQVIVGQPPCLCQEGRPLRRYGITFFTCLWAKAAHTPKPALRSDPAARSPTPLLASGAAPSPDANQSKTRSGLATRSRQTNSTSYLRPVAQVFSRSAGFSESVSIRCLACRRRPSRAPLAKVSSQTGHFVRVKGWNSRTHPYLGSWSPVDLRLDKKHSKRS